MIQPSTLQFLKTIKKNNVYHLIKFQAELRPLINHIILNIGFLFVNFSYQEKHTENRKKIYVCNINNKTIVRFN